MGAEAEGNSTVRLAVGVRRFRLGRDDRPAPVGDELPEIGRRAIGKEERAAMAEEAYRRVGGSGGGGRGNREWRRRG